MTSISLSLNVSKHEYIWRPTKTPPDPPDDYFIASAILFPIVIILVIANILMFAAVLDLIITNKSGETCAGPVLVLNLAVADCLIGIASLISLSDTVNPSKLVNMCYAIIGLVAMPTMASCLIMAAIAFERYRTVRRPFRDRSNDTKKIIAIVMSTWISSSLVGFAPLMGWRTADPYDSHGKCIFLTAVPGSYVLFLFFGIYLPALTVTSYLHIVMCQASKRQGRKIAARETLHRWVERSQSACAGIGRPRTRTEMTEVPTRSNSEVLSSEVRTAEKIFSVAGSIPLDEQNVDRVWQHQQGPSANSSNKHSAHEVSAIEAYNSSRSPNFPKILNTLRPEKWSRTVILILGFFVCMWMPFWIVCVMQAICLQDSCNYEGLASTYLLVLGVSNSAVNPVVYISTDKKLKEHFCRCFFRSADTAIDDESSSVFLSSQDSEQG